MHDNNISDVQVWVDRIWKDVDSHSIFANIVLKVKALNIFAKISSTYYDYSGFPLPSLLWTLNRLAISVKSFIHMNMPWKSQPCMCESLIFCFIPCSF
jgi:hypothetical protein